VVIEPGSDSFPLTSRVEEALGVWMVFAVAAVTMALGVSPEIPPGALQWKLPSVLMPPSENSPPPQGTPFTTPREVEVAAPRLADTCDPEAWKFTLMAFAGGAGAVALKLGLDTAAPFTEMELQGPELGWTVMLPPLVMYWTQALGLEVVLGLMIPEPPPPPPPTFIWTSEKNTGDGRGLGVPPVRVMSYSPGLA
jgi:hypothetical protein